MKTTATKTTEKFSDRVRFNWGFHDATHDASMGWPNRLLTIEGPSIARPLPNDPAYCEGYRRGQQSFAALGYRVESSEAAWNEFMR